MSENAPHFGWCAAGHGWRQVEDVNGQLRCVSVCLANRRRRRRAGYTRNPRRAQRQGEKGGPAPAKDRRKEGARRGKTQL